MGFLDSLQAQIANGTSIAASKQPNASNPFIAGLMQAMKNAGDQQQQAPQEELQYEGPAYQEQEAYGFQPEWSQTEDQLKENKPKKNWLDLVDENANKAQESTGTIAQLAGEYLNDYGNPLTPNFTYENVPLPQVGVDPLFYLGTSRENVADAPKDNSSQDTSAGPSNSTLPGDTILDQPTDPWALSMPSGERLDQLSPAERQAWQELNTEIAITEAMLIAGAFGPALAAGEAASVAAPIAVDALANTAARETGETAVKALAEGSVKEAGKEIAETGAKNAGKEVAENVAKETGEEVLENTTKEAAKNASKEAAEETVAKGAAEETTNVEKAIENADKAAEEVTKDPSFWQRYDRINPRINEGQTSGFFRKGYDASKHPLANFIVNQGTKAAVPLWLNSRLVNSTLEDKDKALQQEAQAQAQAKKEDHPVGQLIDRISGSYQTALDNNGIENHYGIPVSDFDTKYEAEILDAALQSDEYQEILNRPENQDIRDLLLEIGGGEMPTYFDINDLGDSLDYSNISPLALAMYGLDPDRQDLEVYGLKKIYQDVGAVPYDLDTSDEEALAAAQDALLNRKYGADYLINPDIWKQNAGYESSHVVSDIDAMDKWVRRWMDKGVYGNGVEPGASLFPQAKVSGWNQLNDEDLITMLVAGNFINKANSGMGISQKDLDTMSNILGKAGEAYRFGFVDKDAPYEEYAWNPTGSNYSSQELLNSFLGVPYDVYQGLNPWTGYGQTLGDTWLSDNVMSAAEKASGKKVGRTSK